MRVFVVSNFSTLTCGVAEFGRTLVDELQRWTDIRVGTWDGEPFDLAAVAKGYDLIHVNWHPGTMGHYAPDHFPDLPLSLYLHDVPPWSTCLLEARARWVWAAEPYSGAETLPYPAVADADRGFAQYRTIGWTGIRGDGLGAVQAWADKHDWHVNVPTAWLPTREEIRRLSHSTVNVLWYFASDRGQSLALMSCAAARRPLVINNSKMFQTAWRYPKEVYRAGFDPAAPYLETALEQVLDDLAKQRARVPKRLVEQHSWEQAVKRLERAWRG